MYDIIRRRLVALQGGAEERLRLCVQALEVQHLYEEFTRLAETRLAQKSSNQIKLTSLNHLKLPQCYLLLLLLLCCISISLSLSIYIYIYVFSLLSLSLSLILLLLLLLLLLSLLSLVCSLPEAPVRA